MLYLTNSKALLGRAQKVIPDATHTYSKGHFMFPDGVPFAVRHAIGPYVFDVDGNKFIDWTAALCAMSLGYGNKKVWQATLNQAIDGNVFGLPHIIETEAAELFCELTGYDMVRFAKNGSDATTHAVRLARAVTGREYIIKMAGHYHGCADWAQTWNQGCEGIPWGVKHGVIQACGVTSIERMSAEVTRQAACVILEPVQTEVPPAGYLESLREWCTSHGTLLIFDEVITGFRCATGGWAEVSGVKPDLACFGKAMANGWPVSALAGKREYMEQLGKTFMSYTFGGEAVSLAACKATMEVYKEHDVCKQLAENGAEVHCFLRQAKIPGMVVSGFPWRTVVKFVDESGKDDIKAKSIFIQQCFENGLMTNGQFIPTLSHDKGIQERTVNALYQVLAYMSAGGALVGEPIKGAGVR